MSSPTRFTHGLSTAAKSAPLGMFGLPDPTGWHTFFDDFDRYNASDWIITTTEAGAGSASEALTAIDGGALLITNDAADNDCDFFQGNAASFLMAAGKRAFFKCRFKVSDATQSDVVIGLQVTDTTPLAVTDGIFFQKDDGDTHIDFYCQKDASTGLNSVADIAELADDTFVELAWAYDGVGSVAYFVNGVQKGTLSATSAFLPDATLNVSFGIQNGEAVSKTMTLDYVFAAKER